jgi:hypothetical protein
VVVVEMILSEEATISVSTSTQRRWFTSYVQALMAAIMEEPVEPDGDGDFPVPGETAWAWVRPVADRIGLMLTAVHGGTTPIAATSSPSEP